MNTSIRTFLLINLLLSVTMITTLDIVGNLILSHKDIQAQLDTQLIHTAISLHSILRASTLTEQEKKALKENMLSHREKKLHLQGKNISQSTSNNLISNHFFLELQVWDKNKNLTIRSPGAPKTPFTDGAEGLTTVTTDKETWRVYTLNEPDNGDTIMIAEHNNYRQALENRLTEDSILIMLISYPFLGILIWFIVGKGLRSLKKVTKAVSQRAPSYLEPVDSTTAPTEIIPLVSAINRLLQRLKNALDREKRFTADAAHELKTPLAAVSTQAQVALNARDSSSQQKAIQKVLTGINRSNHVIQQLLILSRMTPEATVHQEMSYFKLSREVTDMAAMLAHEAIHKNIDLEFLSPENNTYLYGNPTAMGILIRNLIDNAIRYTPENGWVNIKLEETPQHITLIVSDSGPGIPEALRQRVFERFYRIIGNASSGSGLGLGIVQQIAQLHEAELSLGVPSGEKKGLEVRVTFKKAKKRPHC